MPENALLSDADVVYTYPKDQAIADGVLVKTGIVKAGEYTYDVCFTKALLAEYEKPESRQLLVERGIELLNTPNPEDNGYYKLRVIVKDCFWVIWNAEGITFLHPEDD